MNKIGIALGCIALIISLSAGDDSLEVSTLVVTDRLIVRDSEGHDRLIVKDFGRKDSTLFQVVVANDNNDPVIVMGSGPGNKSYMSLGKGISGPSVHLATTDAFCGYGAVPGLHKAWATYFPWKETTSDHDAFRDALSAGTLVDGSSAKGYTWVRDADGKESALGE